MSWPPLTVAGRFPTKWWLSNLWLRWFFRHDCLGIVLNNLSSWMRRWSKRSQASWVVGYQGQPASRNEGTAPKDSNRLLWVCDLLSPVLPASELPDEFLQDFKTARYESDGYNFCYLSPGSDPSKSHDLIFIYSSGIHDFYQPPSAQDVIVERWLVLFASFFLNSSFPEYSF